MIGLNLRTFLESISAFTIYDDVRKVLSQSQLKIGSCYENRVSTSKYGIGVDVYYRYINSQPLSCKYNFPLCSDMGWYLCPMGGASWRITT